MKRSRKNGLMWFFSIILLLEALVFFPSISSIIFLIAGILLLPSRKIQAFLKHHIPAIRFKGAIATVLFFIGCLLAPATQSETPPEQLMDPSVSTVEYLDATTPSESITAIPLVVETVPETTVQETTVPTEPSQPVEPMETLPEESTFNIHFIDVGQADAALVECDNHYMLIDGGNRADSNVIYSVLQKAGVQKLDIVVGSHAHEDHIGGLPGAFNYTTSDLTLCPVTDYDSKAFNNFARYAVQNGGGITIPSVGDTYSLGSSIVTILGVNSDSDTNNTSIVLRIDYGETSFLFTGDAEREAEQAILNSGMDLSATVLKVGHHGSDTSTTYPFLREIMPQYAVISVGEGNSYGHPTEDTLSRLRDAEVKTFRTDLQGDITCSSDGKTVTFNVSKNPDADVFSGIGGNSTQQSEPENPAPANVEAAQPEPEADMVWIPKSGKRYHSRSGCSNMNNPSQVTKEQAEARGFTPCKRCY